MLLHVESAAGIVGTYWLTALWLLLRSFLVQSALVGGCSLTSLSELLSIVTDGLAGLLNLCGVLPRGLLLGCPLSTRIWDIYDDLIQHWLRLMLLGSLELFMKEMSLLPGLLWHSAAESPLADAYCCAGGPVLDRGLVLGRDTARFRVA